MGFFLVLTLLPLLIFGEETQKYECVEVDHYKCYFNNVQTTWENPNFDPVCPGSWNYREVEIKSGKIPLLTKDLCKGFMKVEVLKLSHLSIEKIDDYVKSAFHSCDKLKILDLSYNKITKIDEETFGGNWGLKILNLEGNPIKEFPSNFFDHARALTDFNLAGTLIPYLHFDDKLRGLKDIELIQLSHTPILDLEIEKLLMHIPTLKTIHLRDTNIQCSRMTEILNTAALHGLVIKTDIQETLIRHRNYDVSYFKGFECLTKEQWELELMERSVSDLLSENKFNTLFEWIKKNEAKSLVLDKNIQIINEKMDQYYVDAAYVSSFLSFIGTTLTILLVIVSVTSIVMCVKVRRYIEEERYRSYLRQQQTMVIDSKRPLYF